ncbi:MAG: hypothetical protein JST48_02615 [Bacteroidetes bacterium]|nr:hypothetical protein [Bacteroidota bacterium]
MKKCVAVFVSALIILSGCGNKPAYKTTEGKRKLKYYNAIQFGQKERPKKKF